MRAPEHYTTTSGEDRYKVRYRVGGKETSETFRKRGDALEFATVLSAGGVTAAMAWVNARDLAADTQSFAEWFDTYIEQLTGVTPRTRADYRALNRRYLSSIQDLPLPLVTRTHVTGIINGLEGDVSAKTIKNVIHLLSSVMGLAVEEGHIAKNPCRRVRLPKPSLEVTDARFLEPQEFADLLAEIPEHYKPLVMFLVGTGMRWSEATALSPRAVSLDRGTVRVERAWKYEGAGRGWVLGPPKSSKSRRTVNAAVIALKAVAPLLDGEYVFTTPTKLVVRHNNFYNRIWKPAVERAGLTGVRIHDLRHSHASWLISDGQPLEAVQDQLGHESILTTRRVYGHLQPAIGVAVGKSASQTLARALGHSVEAGNGPLRLDAVQVADEAADAEDVAADGGDRGDAEGDEGR